MRVEILKDTKAGGETVVKGDVVELDKGDGNYLISIKKARLTTAALKRVETPHRRKVAAAEKAKADAEAKAKAEVEAKAKAESEANQQKGASKK